MRDKTRTITLTNRPPVTIREDAWPIIAHATDERGRDHWHRKIIVDLRVRQHADGRIIVYGVYGMYDHTSRWQGEASPTYRDGVTLPTSGTDQIIAAIHTVADQLAIRSGSDLDELTRACIADLPAESI